MKHQFFSRACFILIIFVLVLSGLPPTTNAAQLPDIHLIFWDSGWTADTFASLFDQWAAQNAPGSDIEATDLSFDQLQPDLEEAIAAGEGVPDIMVVDGERLIQLQSAGLLQPLRDMVDYSLFAFERFDIPSTNYGVPQHAGNHLMMFYNKSLVPAPPTTFDDLKAVAKGFEGTDTLGFATITGDPFWFVAFAGGFGASFFAEDGSFALGTEAWIDAYQFVLDLEQEMFPEGCGWESCLLKFFDSEVAIVFDGDWDLPDYVNALGAENVGVAPWPALPNGNHPAPFRDFRYVVIPSAITGERLETVLAFVQWLTTSEEAVSFYVTETKRLPALDSMFESPLVLDDPILSGSAEAFAAGVTVALDENRLPRLNCSWGALYNVIQDGDWIPAEAAPQAQQLAEECAH